MAIFYLDTGSIGNLQVSSSLFISGATQSSGNGFVLTYNTSSGLVSYTASATVGEKVLPGGSDTQIQFNSGSTFEGSVRFTYNYLSQSLQQGRDVIASGIFSHAEGRLTQTGTTKAYYAESVVAGVIVLTGSYGNITSSFIADNILYYDDSEYGNNYGITTFAISRSYFSTPNTVIELYTTPTSDIGPAIVGNLSLGVVNWLGDQRAGGAYSHAEGYSVQAFGDYGHAEGYETQAMGEGSHAEGRSTGAIGDYSHAEGQGAQAIGDYSHAEGSGSIAIGNYSHAEGQGAQAIGDYSHAAGWNTVASGQYQSVVGQFNISSSDQSAFIVGNGSDDTNRSNLLFASGSLVQITGSLNIAITGSPSIGGSNITGAAVLIGTVSTGLGIDSNEIYTTGSNLFIGTLGLNSINFRVNSRAVPIPALAISSSGFINTSGSLRVGESLTVVQNVGIGVTANQTASLDILGTIRSRVSDGTILFAGGEVTGSGVPTGDGIRIKYEENLFGISNDGLVFEKTDFNNPSVDGGMMFANLNSGSTTRVPIMSMRGSGNVGIGITSPTTTLDVSGSGRFTDGLTVTGSFTVITGSNIELRVTDIGVKIGSVLTDIHQVTGSLNVTGSITGSLFGTSSWAVSASWAPSAVSTIATLGSTIYSTNPAAGTNFNTTHSIFLGSGSGQGATNAKYSNFIGTGSGFSATNAESSNFIGTEAGRQAANAFYSNFIGSEAGRQATTAQYSNFIGWNAGSTATSADNSNFLGTYAGSQATRANSSQFIGPYAGQGATNANFSNFIGNYAGTLAYSASYSTLIGHQAGYNNGGIGVGINNIIIGTNISLPDNTTSSINIGGVLFGTNTHLNTSSFNPRTTPVPNGRIGIRIAAPTTTLDVSGSGRFTNGLTITGSAFISGLANTAQTNVLTYNLSTGQLFYTASSAIGGGGSTTPQGLNQQIQYNNAGAFGGVSTLTFDGTTLRATGSFTGSFVGSLTGTSSWAVSASNLTPGLYNITSSLSSGIQGGTTNYLPLWSSSTTLASSEIYQSSSNIGIGTISPVDRLYVESGSISLRASTGTTPWTSMIKTYPTSVGGVGMGVSMWSADAAGIADAYGHPGFVGRNLYYSASQFYAATTNANSNWGVVAGMMVTNTDTRFLGRVASENGTNFALGTNIDPITRMVIATGGNVGIGTVSPSFRLDVSGSGRFTGGLTVTGSAFISGLANTAQTNVLTYNLTTGQIFYTASSAIGGGGSTTPQGLDQQIQYNDGGVFGGVSTLTYDGTLLRATGSFTGSFVGSLTGTSSWAVSASNLTPGLYNITASLASNAVAGAPALSLQFNNSGLIAGAAGVTYNTSSLGLQQGSNVIASGSYSHAEGVNTQAIGDYSHAEGDATKAYSEYSHAEGRFTNAGALGYIISGSSGAPAIVNGQLYLSESYGNVTSSFTAGGFILLGHFLNSTTRYTITSSAAALTFTAGKTGILLSGSVGTINHPVDTVYRLANPDNLAPSKADVSIDINQHAEGGLTKAFGNAAHSEGINTQAIGIGSHAEGSAAFALGAFSHAEGSATQAIGTGAHAEGTQTTASGVYSHAEGEGTQAIGQASNTKGLGTIAQGNYQLAIGQYNIADSSQAAFIVGNGSSTSARSNLLVARSSQVEVSGSLIVAPNNNVELQVTSTGVKIGNTTADIHQVTGSLRVTGSAFISGLANTAQTNVLTYNSSTGQVFFTASSAIGGGVSTLPGGSNTQIQFNSGSTFAATASFAFNYLSQSLQQGSNVTASGIFSHAEGNSTRAIGNASHAEGFNTLTGITTAYSASIVGGVVTLAASYGDLVNVDYEDGECGLLTTGQFLYVYDINSMYLENRGIFRILSCSYDNQNTKIVLDNPFITAYPTYVFWFQADGGIGCKTGDQIIPGDYSHVQGLNSQAIARYSHAEGYDAITLGEYSHAENRGIAMGQYSHAEGDRTAAIGSYSHAEGYYAQAIGQVSHAEGSSKTGTLNAYSASIRNGIVTMSANYGNIASMFGADSTMYVDSGGGLATPYYKISQSYYQAPNTIVKLYDTSLTIPSYTYATVGDLSNLADWNGNVQIAGNYAHSEGYLTVAIGAVSHAEGSATQAIGEASHTEGLGTRTLGRFSHAEGSGSITIGNYSHAEGTGTQAMGEGSHAEGSNTLAIGNYSHAAGFNTIASGSYQSVIGRFNIPSSAQSAFIIGNGVDDNTRSNLLYAAGSQVQVTGSLLLTGSFTLTAPSASIVSGSASGSFVTNLGDTYTSIAPVTKIVSLTSAEYSGLATPDSNTLYIII